MCNVHLLRELHGIFELTKQEWAQEMADFLLKVKNQKETGELDAKKLSTCIENVKLKGEESNPIRPKEKNTSAADRSKVWHVIS
ncbi:hypothetical protein FJQ98_02405 [Lysinibacillus agricola]|uniref:Transposase n=1 Tax=Lysinibacillus agricola TaxID=2590012 RepID=A0ABX7AV01_9BACI|nr:hypothetical protein FJQ98_02405 [Lysinibacillus agricola]